MPLADDVKARINDERLRALTNQGARAATAVNDAVLDLAVADATADFELDVGLPFDDSVASHVAAGIQGVLYYLESYASGESEAVGRMRTRWERMLAKLARTVGSDAPLLAETDSPIELPQNEQTRPAANSEVAWGDVILDTAPGNARDPRRNG